MKYYLPTTVAVFLGSLFLTGYMLGKEKGLREVLEAGERLETMHDVFLFVTPDMSEEEIIERINSHARWN